MRLNRGGRLAQVLPDRHSGVVLSAKIRVVSGKLKVSAGSGQRIEDPTQLSAAELDEISIATGLLDTGPQLPAILLGSDGNAEQVHWGFQPGDIAWVAELQTAKTFLARTGLTAVQMRTPPGSVARPGLALQAQVIDQQTGDPDLVISGLTETP